jgi:L-asparaginase II
LLTERRGFEPLVPVLVRDNGLANRRIRPLCQPSGAGDCNLGILDRLSATPNPVLARVWRGSTVESVHRGAVAVVSRDGYVEFSMGDLDAPQCLRSTAKPFQALAALETILDSGFEVSDAEIAVISSSHSGQPRHVDLVRGLLRRAGLQPSDLRCGAHAPTHHPSAVALLRAGEEPSALHNNCSGKHAAMLIAAKVLGASLDEYLAPDHPVQIRNRDLLARFAGVEPASIGVAVDGCSAPTFILPLRRLALAFANLVNLEWNLPLQKRWLNAIANEPVAYAGDGRTCTKLVSMAPGAFYPKIGAEGMYVVGQAGLGIATKIDDGHHRATEALVATLLLRFGGHSPEAGAALRDLQQVPIKNHRGLVVGRIEVTLP